MFSTTYADVVSVARPGSSDGGSLPIATRRAPPDAVPEAPVVVPLLLPPPPQPAATKARPRTAASARGRASVVRIACLPAVICASFEVVSFWCYTKRRHGNHRKVRSALGTDEVGEPDSVDALETQRCEGRLEVLRPAGAGDHRRHPGVGHEPSQAEPRG